MSENQFTRAEYVMGKNNLEKIASSRVAVFGVGGVGGYVVEALARMGIGTLDLIDNDTVNLSNINRQIIATHDTVGMLKVDAAEARVHAISPETKVNKYACFYLPEEKDRFDFSQYDYVVDAIDTVTAKIDIIMECQKANTPVISAMGCGNRVDPSKLTVTDIYKTAGDPLAKIMRHEMKKRHVKKLKVVYSTETPLKPLAQPSAEESGGRRSTPGSTAFVPSAAGLFIASEVVRDLTSFDPEHRE